MAGGNPLRHAQALWQLRDVRRAYRVAVHLRVVHGRHIDRRNHRLRQHPAGSVKHGDQFNRINGRRLREHAEQGLFDGEHGRTRKRQGAAAARNTATRGNREDWGGRWDTTSHQQTTVFSRS